MTKNAIESDKNMNNKKTGKNEFQSALDSLKSMIDGGNIHSTIRNVEDILGEFFSVENSDDIKDTNLDKVPAESPNENSEDIKRTTLDKVPAESLDDYIGVEAHAKKGSNLLPVVVTVVSIDKGSSEALLKTLSGRLFNSPLSKVHVKVIEDSSKSEFAGAPYEQVPLSDINPEQYHEFIGSPVRIGTHNMLFYPSSDNPFILTGVLGVKDKDSPEKMIALVRNNTMHNHRIRLNHVYVTVFYPDTATDTDDPTGAKRMEETLSQPRDEDSSDDVMDSMGVDTTQLRVTERKAEEVPFGHARFVKVQGQGQTMIGVRNHAKPGYEWTLVNDRHVKYAQDRDVLVVGFLSMS